MKKAAVRKKVVDVKFWESRTKRNRAMSLWQLHLECGHMEGLLATDRGIEHGFPKTATCGTCSYRKEQEAK